MPKFNSTKNVRKVHRDWKEDSNGVPGQLVEIPEAVENDPEIRPAGFMLPKKPSYFD